VGVETRDDAAVYRLDPERALVVTVDVFTPVVDDPYAYGAIAAANSLSDVYAMGARPFLALNVLAYPPGRLSRDVVAEIVRGGLEKMREAEVVVAGGHSLDDPQPKFGYAVVGSVHPERVVTNAGARPGDRLFLTKPLGIGVITTGIKQQRASAAAVDAATRVMLELNRAASEAMLEVGVHACTDVTGYGLVGHLHELASASGVDVRVWASRVPVLDAAWDLVRQRVVPGGTYRNLRAAARYARWAPDLSEEVQLVLCDAQTSGGLVMAVAPDRAGRLEAALARRRVPVVAEVGEVVGPGHGVVYVS
jgi:selenide,water dikinase